MLTRTLISPTTPGPAGIVRLDVTPFTSLSGIAFGTSVEVYGVKALGVTFPTVTGMSLVSSGLPPDVIVCWRVKSDPHGWVWETCTRYGVVFVPVAPAAMSAYAEAPVSTVPFPAVAVSVLVRAVAAPAPMF